MTTMTHDLDEVFEDALAFEAACLAWARRLPDWMIRSFAYDYRHGDRDPATVDAWEEYQRRFGREPMSDDDRGYRPKLVNRCEKHATAAHPGNCSACRELNGLAPVSRKRSYGSLIA